MRWNQNGKTNLDFTEARDSEWQWHQLGHMQVCTSLQTDNHASTPSLSFLQAGCPFCRPTNSVKALKAQVWQLVCYVQDCLSPLSMQALPAAPESLCVVEMGGHDVTSEDVEGGSQSGLFLNIGLQVCRSFIIGSIISLLSSFLAA